MPLEMGRRGKIERAAMWVFIVVGAATVVLSLMWYR